MRKIFKIAKLELSVLVYSPVVWLVMPIFFVLCGMQFFESLQNIRLGLSLSGGTSPITKELFSSPGGGLFIAIQQTLYLYLPILTMGIMSREISSGSIKLLLSSPVRIRSIILGKYLAMVVISSFFILMLTAFGVLAACTVQHPDLGIILSGLIGLFLLTCTYAAIGLFMSSLTSYQIVAAIATLAVFSLLRYVGAVGQSIDFVRDLTYFLSISGRTEAMIFGLITTRDVFYYIIIIALFLGMSMIYLKNQRDLKGWKVKTARYAGALFLALFSGYITSRPLLTGYADLSAGKQMTMTESGQRIARQIKGKLKVTTYVNLLSPNMSFLMPEYRNNDLSRLDMFKRFLPGMENHYVYYYHEPTDSSYSQVKWNPNFQGMTDVKAIAAKTALLSGYNLNDFMLPAAIDRQINLAPEGYLQVRKLEYNGKSTFLRFFVMSQDQYAGEPEWAAALLRLTDGVPHLIYLTGQHEADITGNNEHGYRGTITLRQRREAMVNQGFDVDTVNIDTQDIPENVTMVVVADPTVSFSAAATERLHKYLDAGGNMLLTSNPGRQAIVNPLLQPLGIQLKAGMLVKPDKNMDQDMINAFYADNATGIDRNVAILHRAKRPVKMQGAAALSYTSGTYQVQPLLQSPAGGWNKAAALDPNAPALSFDTTAGDEKGVFPVAVTMTRKLGNREQRILVSGDADFVDNAVLDKNPLEVEERQLSINVLYRWLADGKLPVDEIRPAPRDLDLRVSREQINILGVIFKFIIPVLIVLSGAILLFRRRAN